MPRTRKRGRKSAARKRKPKPPRSDVFAASPGVDARLEKAFEAAVARYAHRPYVTGIDVGYKLEKGQRTGELAVRIHVNEKKATRVLERTVRFPKKIEGCPVDVIEATYEESSSAAIPVPAPADPLKPGVSLGPLGGGTGTLGIIARQPDGTPCVLSAGHVIAPPGTVAGHPVVQPANGDGGTAAETVGHLTAVDRPSDAAYAKLDGSRGLDAVPVGGTQPIPAGLRYPRLGDVLEKSGRTTGVTRGEVDGIGHFYGVRFAFRLVPLSGQTQPICDHGDSGAAWYDPNSGEGVGLHVKGGPLPVSTMNYAVATSLKKLFDGWGLLPL